MKNNKDLKCRLEIEKRLLEKKINRLEKPLKEGKLNFLSIHSLKEMEKQLHNMKMYRENLIERLIEVSLIPDHEKSVGEKIIGDFNPEGQKDVEEIKDLAKELLNFIHPLIDEESFKRVANKIEEAQMITVKSIFK